MKKVVLWMMMVLMACVAMAAPVQNMPVKRVQPQGDTLYCYVSGDEFFHRLHDAQGYTIVQNVTTGEYVYAALADGLLVPTAYRAGSVNPASVGLKPGLIPDVKELKRLHALWDVPEASRPAAPKSSISSGTLNNLVVFVRFSDESSCTSSTFATIDGMFNDSTAGANSMYNYFWKSSYHDLQVLTHYYPSPSGSTVLSYQDSHPRSYFQPYSASNTNGYVGDSARRAREFQLIQDAVTWVNTNAPVSTSLDIDLDSDGTVDNICFVVSGTYTGWSDLLWPHKWSLYDRYVYINGKRVYTFNLQLAGSGSHYFSTSTFCHEMTHTLGCPDIYNYYNYTDVTAAGSWDLMCSNQTPPQQTNMLFKYRYLDWISTIPQLTDTGTYALHSNGSGPHAYKIASANRNQWYILEYRNTSDTFDSSIPNRGMLIWRYNASSNASNADFDFSTTPHEMWLFRPNSHNDTVSGTISQASFGVSGRSSFYAGSGSSNWPFLSDGTADSTFRLTNIQVASGYDSVTFTFTPAGGISCGTVSTFPLTEGFEDGTTRCWTVETANPANDGRIGVYDNSTSTAHSGNNSFRFSSYARATDYNQWLISPRLNASNPLHLQFYYKKSNSSNEHFLVKYSTTGNAPADFVDTLCNTFASSTSWTLCDLLVPQAARYVAIDYCSDYLYYLYIDDISLTDTLRAGRDTTYIHIFDTVVTWQHDTVHVTLYDTVFHPLEVTVRDTIRDTMYVRDTAYLTYDWYQLHVVSRDTNLGLGVGTGIYRQDSEPWIGAKSKSGYRFDRWMDGNRDNPRQVTVAHDMTYVAYFEPLGTKEIPLNTIHDTLVVHDTVYVTRVAHDTVYHFGTLHLYDTILTVLDPLYDTVRIDLHVELDTATMFTLSLDASDPAKGFTIGGGTFPLGTVTEVAAIPYEGYRFVAWSDGVVDDIRTLSLMQDQSLMAYFEVDTGGAASLNPVVENLARVYALGSTLVVEAQGGKTVSVYNTLGQLVARRQLPAMGGELRILGLPDGFYAVQVDRKPAHKVLIMK